MIVVMRAGATQDQISHMTTQVENLGLRAHVIVGTERTVIAAIGVKRDGTKESLAIGDGVADVVAISAPYKVASLEVKSEKTVVEAGSLQVGGQQIGMIAGPCSVESESQILETAKAVKKSGAHALRGGAFKPRTSPYSFQGMKEEGLQLLQTARDATGLAIVTEVVATEDVELVARYADVLQVGARNMQNYRLLEALGSIDRAVLLKRGPSATVDELLLAAEYILDRGNSRVILCERGIRTYESHTRFTLPLATVSYLHHKTHLPVVVDPKQPHQTPVTVPSISIGCLQSSRIMAWYLESRKSENSRMCAECVSSTLLMMAMCLSPVWKSKFYGAFALHRRVVLHAIFMIPARWRGDAGSSPLDTRHTG